MCAARQFLEKTGGPEALVEKLLLLASDEEEHLIQPDDDTEAGVQQPTMPTGGARALLFRRPRPQFVNFQTLVYDNPNPSLSVCLSGPNPSLQ
jgi:hypothetical protein